MKSFSASMYNGSLKPANICADAGLTLHAASNRDAAFLTEVFASTRREEFARTGWEPAQIDAFLRDQSRLQQVYYHEHYPEAQFDLILLGGEPIGRLYCAWRSPRLGDEVRLIDIALLPKWRGRGIGTQLMHALVTEAQANQLPVSLHVEAENPVKRLYARLGFLKIGTSGIYDLMRREAAPFDVATEQVSSLRRESFGTAMNI